MPVDYRAPNINAWRLELYPRQTREVLGGRLHRPHTRQAADAVRRPDHEALLRQRVTAALP